MVVDYDVWVAGLERFPSGLVGHCSWLPTYIHTNMHVFRSSAGGETAAQCGYGLCGTCGLLQGSRAPALFLKPEAAFVYVVKVGIVADLELCMAAVLALGKGTLVPRMLGGGVGVVGGWGWCSHKTLGSGRKGRYSVRYD